MFWNKLSKISKMENYNPATHFLLNVFWQKNSESPDQHYEKSWRLFPCSGLLSAYMAVPIILQMIFTAVLLNLCLSYFKCTTAKFRMHCSSRRTGKQSCFSRRPKLYTAGCCWTPAYHCQTGQHSGWKNPRWSGSWSASEKLLRFLPIH